MGRKSLKDVRQKEIVLAFYTTAKKEGLDNTSIAKVAEYMRVNPSLVMHYFKTKQELLDSLVDFILEKYLGMYKTKGKIDSREKLTYLVDGLFSKKWNRLFDDGVFYSSYALIYRNKGFKNKFRKLHEKLREKFCQSLTEAAEATIIPGDNLNEKAEIVFALLEGAYYYLGMTSNKEDLNSKMDFYKAHVYKILEFN